MIRRDFIKSSALVAGSFALPFPSLASFSSKDKIKLAIVGTGWWGTEYLLKGFLDFGQFEIVGLCDVNSIALNNAAEKVVAAGQKKPGLFSSYKEMYELDALQAVVIATPTHWHALQFIDACSKGLHIFLEKPISYDIREGQAMLAAHKKAKNVVLVDFPRVMVDTNDQVKEFIESGEAGKILQVQANINSMDGFLVEKEIPSTLDFETYCGPAPKTRYLCGENSTTPSFRGIYDFSRGIMADWGIHYIHNIRRILGLDLPTHVSAIGGITKNFTQENPDFLDVHFDFNGLPVYWTHKSWGFTSPIPDNNIGVFYFGEKSTIFSGDLGWEVYPSSGGEKIIHGEVAFNPGKPENLKLYNQMFTDMFAEFADGIRNKSNNGITNQLESAQKTTSCVIYGDMAYRTKSELSINDSNLNIDNNEVAQKLLKREYRSGYKHPYS